MTKEKRIENIKLALYHIRLADSFLWNDCHEESDLLFVMYNRVEKVIKEIEGENNEKL